MHKNSQIKVSSNVGKNTKSPLLILICSNQNLRQNLNPRSNWSTSTSCWGFTPSSKSARWVESSTVGCGPAARQSLFCRRETDLCERQTLMVYQLQEQNTGWQKKSFGGSGSTNRYWCRAWGSPQSLLVWGEWLWPGQVRVFLPAASSISGDNWCFSPWHCCRYSELLSVNSATQTSSTGLATGYTVSYVFLWALYSLIKTDFQI